MITRSNITFYRRGVKRTESEYMVCSNIHIYRNRHTVPLNVVLSFYKDKIGLRGGDNRAQIVNKLFISVISAGPFNDSFQKS